MNKNIKRTIIVEGKLHHHKDEESGLIAYQLSEVFATPPGEPQVCLTKNDPDKFLVLEDDYDLAKSEFWNRWSSYAKRRFPNAQINLRLDYGHGFIDPDKAHELRKS